MRVFLSPPRPLNSPYLVVQSDILVWDGRVSPGERGGRRERAEAAHNGGDQTYGKSTWSPSEDRREEYPFGGLFCPFSHLPPCSSFNHTPQKFVARKARKFIAQGHRLALPVLEMAYIFHGIAHAPRSVIVTKMLPEVDKALEQLGVLVEVQEREAEFDEKPAVAANVKSEEKREKERKEKEYAAGKGGYWDDYCLALFLRGVCMRYVAYPVCFL